MANGDQVKNGKAFEYAIALEYYRYLRSKDIKVEFLEDKAFKTARSFFNGFDEEQQQLFCLSARASIKTMLKLESGFTSPKNEKDVLTIQVASDQSGEEGDVRDVIFTRLGSRWEVGFSAKNNNDAVKHSRLSATIDFGKDWLGYPVSEHYWESVKPIFNLLQEYKDLDYKWNQVEDKANRIYKPLLEAFKTELLAISTEHSDVPERLIAYLLGRMPFYKIIKDDTSSLIIVKAFNLNGGLNQTVNKVKPAYKTKKINFPTRIVEFDYKKNRDGSVSETTLNMILDEGWEISFRLHNAESKVIPSVKFDVNLLGNPPVLFTQYIFSED